MAAKRKALHVSRISKVEDTDYRAMARKNNIRCCSAQKIPTMNLVKQLCETLSIIRHFSKKQSKNCFGKAIKLKPEKPQTDPNSRFATKIKKILLRKLISTTIFFSEKPKKNPVLKSISLWNRVENM